MLRVSSGKGSAGMAEKDGGGGGGGILKGLGALTAIGITLVASTVVGLLIGLYLDRVFSTKPWFTIIFLILGIIAGFRNIYQIAKKYGF